MEQNLHLHLQNENQRDTPLSNSCENYTPPTTLRGTLTSWTIWKFLIYGSFYGFSASVLMIMVPAVGRTYFDDNTDNTADCDRNSYSRYAFWSAIFHNLTGVVALLSQSYIGRLSDALGRKKFLYFTWVCMTIPIISLCFTNNMWWYFALGSIVGLSGMVTGMPTILQAAISDVTAPQFKTVVFGMMFGSAGVVMMLTSFICMAVVKQWGTRAAFYTCIVEKLVSVLWLVFVIDESLKPSNRKPLDDDINHFDKHNQYLVTQQIELNKIGIDISNGSVQYDPMNSPTNSKCKSWWNSKHNPLRPLGYMKDNKVILWIGVAAVLTSFPETGTGQLSMIYISDNLGLCDEDESSKLNSLLVISAAAGLIFCQLILLPILSTTIHDIKLMTLGVTLLLISFVFGIVLYFIPTQFVALLLYAFQGMSYVIIPIFSGTLTKRVSPREQGVALGVLHALKGLNACVSPFIFAYLYSLFSQKLTHVGCFIAMPYMLGIVVIVLVYPIIWCPLKRVFTKYDEYAFKASVVPFDKNPDQHIPPKQLL
eukprot:176592_1